MVVIHGMSTVFWEARRFSPFTVEQWRQAKLFAYFGFTKNAKDNDASGANDESAASSNNQNRTIHGNIGVSYGLVACTSASSAESLATFSTVSTVPRKVDSLEGEKPVYFCLVGRECWMPCVQQKEAKTLLLMTRWKLCIWHRNGLMVIKQWVAVYKSNCATTLTSTVTALLTRQQLK